MQQLLLLDKNKLLHNHIIHVPLYYILFCAYRGLPTIF